MGETHAVDLMFLNGDNTREYALVVCNTVLEERMVRLWKEASYIVLADGACERSFDFFSEREREEMFIPDMICGDMDSSTEQTRSWYSKKGTGIEWDSSQDTNDLQKCIKHLKDVEFRGHVLIWEDHGGRFDHEMQTINILFLHNTDFESITVLSKSHAMVLLRTGETRISLPPSCVDQTCALVPIGHPCRRVTTSGLRWDLKGTLLAFGATVSTSNRILSTPVSVTASDPLLWSLDLTHE